VATLRTSVGEYAWQQYFHGISSFQAWLLDYRARGLDFQFNDTLLRAPDDADELLLLKAKPEGDQAIKLRIVWKDAGLAGPFNGSIMKRVWWRLADGLAGFANGWLDSYMDVYLAHYVI